MCAGLSMTVVYTSLFTSYNTNEVGLEVNTIGLVTFVFYGEVSLTTVTDYYVVIADCMGITAFQ